MVAVQWNRGFQRLAMLTSGIVVAIGVVLTLSEGLSGTGALFLLGLAALPWAIFFAVRWLLRGFIEKKSPPGLARDQAPQPQPPVAPPQKQARSGLWPAVDTPERARAVARQAGWVALIVAGLTVIVVTISLQSEDVAKALHANAYGYVDAFLFLLIAVGLFRLSRVAAIAGLLLYFAESAAVIGQASAANIVIKCFIILAFNSGVRATLAYHRLTSAAKAPVHSGVASPSSVTTPTQSGPVAPP